ncbi:hypothetical protein QLQ15_12585 [Lysobacter sp. LF1]|uniref:Uncharacterized protein n=1 Tax=Lysobacter stagni TaxID=3045172 RepID=A0ABT6XHV8_9GAMM|nr:hypothetical protein [Lysobacter sp. LF1]MDI9239741.1 hypothetical protein [Lysobacter sp. LF1]
MAPQRSSLSVPAVDTVLRVAQPPRDPQAVYLDLLTQSLRDACDTQGDRVFPLIAQMIDHHIAGSLQTPRIGRWRNEALDCLLALISPRMPGQVRHLLADTVQDD